MASSKRDMKERISFVRFWADYMKKNTNEKWSRQHSNFINSIMRTADRSIKTYLKVRSVKK